MILIICIVNLGIYCDQDLLAAHLGRWEGLKKHPIPTSGRSSKLDGYVVDQNWPPDDTKCSSPVSRTQP